MKNKGIFLLLGAGFLYGFWGVISRSLHNELPLFFQFWTRNLLVIFAFVLLLSLTKTWKKVERKDIKWFIIRIIAGAIGTYPFYYVFNYLPIGTVYFTSYSALAISGYIISFLFFKERINFSEIVALVFAIVGLLLIYAFSFNFSKILYLFLALSSGVGYAMWGTFSKKISNTYSWIQSGAIESTGGFIIAFLISYLLKEHWVLPSLNRIWLINFSFILVYTVPFILIFYGFKHIAAHVGNLVLLSEVLFGIILGFLFYKETISFLNLIGCLLILMAIALPDLIGLAGKLQRK